MHALLQTLSIHGNGFCFSFYCGQIAMVDFGLGYKVSMATKLIHPREDKINMSTNFSTSFNNLYHELHVCIIFT